MLTLKPANSGGYRAYWENSALIGEVYREVDGYYVFWPVWSGGSWSEGFCRSMADKLQELNKDWHEQVCRDLCGPSSETVGEHYKPTGSNECPF